MLFLATYDIESNSLRTKLAERLLKMGLERVQYSVYIGPLTAAKRASLLKTVDKMFGEQENVNFLLMLLEQNALQTDAHVGTAPPDWDYLKGKINTLII